jgi:hypothetical protein
VTRDDIRKLIGAYATGTLTEAERKLLFDAALDDQELFDELTREHALKEILDEPGARDRLIAALDPPAAKRLVWWPWAAAGTAVAFAATVVAIVSLRTPARQEIALVAPAPAPAVKEEPARPARPAPAPPSASVAPTAPAAKTKAAKLEETQANQPAAEPVFAASAQADAAPPPPPAARALSVETGRIALAAAKPARFAFDYAAGPDGTLRITPAADGYLRVLAMNGDAAGPALTLEGAGPDGRVQAGSQVSVSVSGRDAVEILFSASPGAAPAQPPERRTETSGTVADPNPSPASSLAVIISVK